MKNHNKQSTKYAIGLLLLTCSLAPASSVIINFSPNNDTASGVGHAADPASGAVFSSDGTMGTAPISFGDGVSALNQAGRGTFDPFTLTGTDSSGATVTGTFHLSVTLTATSTGTQANANRISRGGVGAVGVGSANSDATISLGESLTVSNLILINVSGADASAFQFDGFSSVFIGNNGSNETVFINDSTTAVAAPTVNTNFVNSAGGGGLAIDDLSTSFTVAGASGDFSLNGITAEFSVAPIPEPSSTALLGLGALGYILRRRR